MRTRSDRQKDLYEHSWLALADTNRGPRYMFEFDEYVPLVLLNGGAFELPRPLTSCTDIANDNVKNGTPKDGRNELGQMRA